MRRGNESSFMFDDAGRMILVSLGADFTSEHEWGIKEIRDAFGILGTEKASGLLARTITRVPPQFGHAPDGTGAVLWLNRGNPLDNQFFKSELSFRHGEDVAGAWDSKSFGLRVTSKHVVHLADLAAAFQRLDVAIWIGGRQFIENGGLILAIASRVPAEGAENMRKGDESNKRLRVVAAATGIEERLSAKGLRWFALSPRWTDASETAVMFWLNPMEQDRYEAGWFSVAQLDEWAQGKGPVMMKKRRSRR